MLLIHTALHAEAAPVIAHFNLGRVHDACPFNTFNHKDIWLVESGIGKTQTATAVSWLCARLGDDDTTRNLICLNIGIAGCKNLSIGEMVRIQRIEDQASGQCWYPPQLTDTHLATGNLLTVDQETEDYPDNVLIDMEASGFYTAACHFTTLELVHSLKVVSDNPDYPPHRYNAKDISRLLSPHLAIIDTFANNISRFLDQNTTRTISYNISLSSYQQLQRQFHFSHYQSQQLKRLLQCYCALYPEHNPVELLSSDVNNAKMTLQWLQRQIEYAPAAAY